MAAECEASSKRLDRLWDVAAIVLLACMAAVVLAAPLFPSQDGPVHLYYADVLRELLKHSGPYTEQFAIKSLLTPYMLEYYSLLALETAFSPAMSEKILICGYIFGFGLGFRYLVASVAERRGPWTLVGIPFCMNVMVYLGFLNYCFGVAFLLFLSGVWLRYQERLNARRVAALLAGLVLMLLTHPVPVALFLLFIGIHLAVELVLAAAHGSGAWMTLLKARRGQLALITVMGVIAMGWVGMFVSRSTYDPAPNNLSRYGVVGTFNTELALTTVMPFTSTAYRIGPILLVGAGVLTLFLGYWRKVERVAPTTLALGITSAICFALYFVVPMRINDSWYFPERFPVFWVTLLLAAAATLPVPRWWGMAVGAMALGVTGWVVILQWENIARIDSALQPALDAAPSQAGAKGVIAGPRVDTPDGLAFNPYMWSGAHYFRRSRAILSNTPWMDLPIIMLKPLHPDRWNYLDPADAAEVLSHAVATGDGVRELDFVVQEGTATTEMRAMRNRMGWQGVTDEDGLLRVYRRRP